MPLAVTLYPLWVSVAQFTAAGSRKRKLVTGWQRSAFRDWWSWESGLDLAVDSSKVVGKRTGLEIIQKLFVTKPGACVASGDAGKDSVSRYVSGALGGGVSVDFGHFLKKWARAC